MTTIFINTIVGAADNISQLDLVNHLDEISTIAKKNNWDVYISYPNDLFDLTGIHKEAQRAIREAEEHGVLSVKMNTGNLAGIEKINRTQFNDLFQDAPLEVSIENGAIQYVQKAFDALSEQSLPIGFTFDMGNWVIREEDPTKVFNHYKEKTTAFHLNIPYIIEYAIPLENIQSEVNKLK